MLERSSAILWDMETSPAALSAGSVTTAPGVPPRDRVSRRALDRRLYVPQWWRRACAIAALCSIVVVVALWIMGGGVQDLARAGTGLASISRLTGQVGSDLLLLQVFLMARIPLVERAFGQDELARRHDLAVCSIGFLAGPRRRALPGPCRCDVHGSVGRDGRSGRSRSGHAADPHGDGGTGRGRHHGDGTGSPLVTRRVLAAVPPVRLSRSGPSCCRTSSGPVRSF